MFEIGLIHDHPLIEWAVSQALSEAPDMRVHVLSTGYDVAAGGSRGSGGPDDPGGSRDSVRELPERLDVLVLDRPPERATPAEAAVTRASCVLLMPSTGHLESVCPGVNGYLSERSDPVALAAAVREAAVRSRGTEREGETAEEEAALLSVRERQVIRMLARGLTHHQIARRLGISHHTVDTYVKRMRSKLGLGNKAELVRAAMAYGWD
ncbi:response regulator transcription factor [Streptomyces sp. NPDC088915]|uniref:response regulator transcription factor n=1 Tax=Streptomyces sp. NPDC088915 TaxID=3365912 RepID=UPI0038061525